MNDRNQGSHNQRNEEETKNPFKEKELSEQNITEEQDESSGTAAAEQERKEAITERD